MLLILITVCSYMYCQDSTHHHSVWTSLPDFVKDLFKLINLCSQDFSENLTFNLYLTLPYL